MKKTIFLKRNKFNGVNLPAWGNINISDTTVWQKAKVPWSLRRSMVITDISTPPSFYARNTTDIFILHYSNRVIVTSVVARLHYSRQEPYFLIGGGRDTALFYRSWPLVIRAYLWSEASERELSVVKDACKYSYMNFWMFNLYLQPLLTASDEEHCCVDES